MEEKNAQSPCLHGLLESAVEKAPQIRRANSGGIAESKLAVGNNCKTNPEEVIE
jgi:hypothetical protein